MEKIEYFYPMYINVFWLIVTILVVVYGIIIGTKQNKKSIFPFIFGWITMGVGILYGTHLGYYLDLNTANTVNGTIGNETSFNISIIMCISFVISHIMTIENKK